MTKVAVYSICMGKPDLLKESFLSLGRHAGVEFDHFVWDQDTDPEVTAWLQDREQIHYYTKGKNVGQNIAANFLLDAIFEKNPEVQWILRWDPDALTRSRRFLKRMIRVSERFIEEGAIPILSPFISKLENVPEAKHKANDLSVDGKAIEYEVVRILGGICRLHPADFFHDWRFNHFMPMGLGEAAEVADRVTQLAMQGLPWVTIRLPWLKVEHAYGEKGQIKRYPEEFGMSREMGRYVGYGL